MDFYCDSNIVASRFGDAETIPVLAICTCLRCRAVWPLMMKYGHQAKYLELEVIPGKNARQTHTKPCQDINISTLELFQTLVCTFVYRI